MLKYLIKVQKCFEILSNAKKKTRKSPKNATNNIVFELCDELILIIYVLEYYEMKFKCYNFLALFITLIMPILSYSVRETIKALFVFNFFFHTFTPFCSVPYTNIPLKIVHNRLTSSCDCKGVKINVPNRRN